MLEAGSRRFYACSGIVRGQLTPGSSEVTVVEESTEYSALQGQGEGDLAVWTEVNLDHLGSRVRGWMPDGQGARTVLDGIPGDTCLIGISDDHIAGLMYTTDGSRDCSWFQANSQFWIAQRGEGATAEMTSFSPVFSDSPLGYFRKIATWGDYIAAVMVNPLDQRPTLSDRSFIVLARTTDWAMRRIDHVLPDTETVEVALGPGYVYVIYTGVGAQYGKYHDVYRYDLDDFEQIGTQLLPPSAGAAPE